MILVEYHILLSAEHEKWLKRTFFNVLVATQKNALGCKLLNKCNTNQNLRESLCPNC